MQIFINTYLPNKLTMTFECEETDNIFSIKEYIFKKTSIPIIQQRLMYLGKQLAEEQLTLKNYNIHKEICIDVLLPLRGGMHHPTSST
jgi:hypothetical protein